MGRASSLYISFEPAVESWTMTFSTFSGSPRVVPFLLLLLSGLSQWYLIPGLSLLSCGRGAVERAVDVEQLEGCGACMSMSWLRSGCMHAPVSSVASCRFLADQNSRSRLAEASSRPPVNRPEMSAGGESESSSDDAEFFEAWDGDGGDEHGASSEMAIRDLDTGRQYSLQPVRTISTPLPLRLCRCGPSRTMPVPRGPLSHPLHGLG